ncbi:hypothetical protein DFJ74DRAFT_706611 [Hyaloraphidium curvatum]|nr:hypothetical protein DFJ74DRAFT_706611 [Hyaloraphidium curvatum]
MLTALSPPRSPAGDGADAEAVQPRGLKQRSDVLTAEPNAVADRVAQEEGAPDGHDGPEELAGEDEEDEGNDVANEEEDDEVLDKEEDAVEWDAQSEDAAPARTLRPYEQDIVAALEAVAEDGSGLDFVCGGPLPALRPPAVSVEGVGRLAFPLCREQAATVVSPAKAALAGGGAAVTGIGKDVGGPSSIPAERVVVGGPGWDGEFLNVVQSVCDTFHLDRGKLGVQARLRDLLLFEAGCDFRHRLGGEAVDGFASLLVQLPAEHTGGDMVVAYGPKEDSFDSSECSADQMYFTAFFSECRVAVKPLRTGMRLALEWLADCEGCGKLAFALRGEYVEDKIEYSALKGADKAVVGFLASASGPEGDYLFGVHVVLMERTERGYTDWSPMRRGYTDLLGYYDVDSDDDSYPGGASITELEETELGTLHWINVAPDGGLAMLPRKLNVDLDRELIGTAVGDLFGEDPDEKEYDKDTATLTHWFQSAIVVFWPRQRTVPLLLSLDLGVRVCKSKRQARTKPNEARKQSRKSSATSASGAVPQAGSRAAAELRDVAVSQGAGGPHQQEDALRALGQLARAHGTAAAAAAELLDGGGLRRHVLDKRFRSKRDQTLAMASGFSFGVCTNNQLQKKPKL